MISVIRTNKETSMYNVVKEAGLMSKQQGVGLNGYMVGASNTKTDKMYHD